MKTYAKSIRTLLILLIVTIFCQQAFGDIVRRQRKVKTDEPFRPWTFQFAFDGRMDNDDDEYEGVRLSIMKKNRSGSALRFNLGFVERDNLFLNDGIVETHDADLIFHNHYYPTNIDGANLSLQYLFYPSPGNTVDFFWGMGPRLSAYETGPGTIVSHFNNFPFEWMESVDSKEGVRLGFGLEGSLGMEWHLGRSISVLAEYGFIAQNEWYIMEVERYNLHGRLITDHESFDDGIHLYGSQARIGFSIHF
ncbi:MAG: hypothetical protein ABIE07_13615 [Candidatus Zixiibacteriota bacterium]